MRTSLRMPIRTRMSWRIAFSIANPSLTAGRSVAAVGASEVLTAPRTTVVTLVVGGCRCSSETDAAAGTMTSSHLLLRTQNADLLFPLLRCSSVGVLVFLGGGGVWIGEAAAHAGACDRASANPCVPFVLDLILLPLFLFAASPRAVGLRQLKSPEGRGNCLKGGGSRIGGGSLMPQFLAARCMTAQCRSLAACGFPQLMYLGCCVLRWHSPMRCSLAQRT